MWRKVEKPNSSTNLEEYNLNRAGLLFVHQALLTLIEVIHLYKE
jgi:hypothetical protein